MNIAPNFFYPKLHFIKLELRDVYYHVSIDAQFIDRRSKFRLK